MIEHAQARDLAAVGLDFDLTDQERSELSAHRQLCKACDVYGTQLHADAGAVRRLPDPPGPADLRPMLQTSTVGRIKDGRMTPSTLAVVVALLLASVIGATVGVGALINRTEAFLPTEGGVQEVVLEGMAMNVPAEWRVKLAQDPEVSVPGGRELLAWISTGEIPAECTTSDTCMVPDSSHLPDDGLWASVVSVTRGPPPVYVDEHPLPSGLEPRTVDGRAAAVSRMVADPNNSFAFWIISAPEFPDAWIEIEAAFSGPRGDELFRQLDRLISGAAVTEGN